MIVKIRVQTIDGDVDYIDLVKKYICCDYRGHLAICKCILQHDLYPEYRVSDLDISFYLFDEKGGLL